MRIKLYLTLIIFILIFSSTSEGARIGNMFSESQDFKRDHLSDYSTSSKPYNKDMKNVIFDVHNVFTENFGQLQNP